MQNVDPWKSDGQEAASGKSNSELSASDLISAIFKDPTGEVARQWTLVRIQSRWPDIAGNLARHSWPERISGRRLVVRVSHDVYAQEFFLFRADIVKKLRAYGIREIDEIQIDKGRVKFSRPVESESVTLSPRASEESSQVNPDVRDFLEKLKKI